MTTKLARRIAERIRTGAIGRLPDGYGVESGFTRIAIADAIDAGACDDILADVPVVSPHTRMRLLELARAIEDDAHGESEPPFSMMLETSAELRKLAGAK